MKHFPGLWETLLCLLPFEPAFFARHGLPAMFVGHPVLESGAGGGDGPGFRVRHGMAADAPVVTVMPGSRRSEVGRMLPVFGDAVAELAARVPGLRPVVPVAAPVAAAVIAGTRSWAMPPVVVTDTPDKLDGFAASAVALTKSGTSTLELAMAGVPMVVGHRANPMTAAIVRRLITVRYASLLNLLGGEEVVPELLQEDCTPARVADVLHGLLAEPARAAAQRARFGPVLDALRPPSGTPSEAAAAAVLRLLDQA